MEKMKSGFLHRDLKAAENQREMSRGGRGGRNAGYCSDSLGALMTLHGKRKSVFSLDEFNQMD